MSPRRTRHASLNAMFQLNSWIPLLSVSSKLTVRGGPRSPAKRRPKPQILTSWPEPRRQVPRAVESPPCQAWDIQSLEPMLLPRIRICFADFPWSHCSIDQRLFTSESGCGYRYGPPMRDWISGGSSLRIAKAPNGTKSVPLSLCVQTPSSN